MSSTALDTGIKALVFLLLLLLILFVVYMWWWLIHLNPLHPQQPSEISSLIDHLNDFLKQLIG